MDVPALYLQESIAGRRVIFISIDDNELVNLRKLCDEIFWRGKLHWFVRSKRIAECD